MTAGQEAARGELLDVVRRLLRDTSPVSAAHLPYEDGSSFDRELWRLLGTGLGLAGVHVPPPQGGSGAGHAEVALVVRELGRVLARTPYLISAGVATSVLISLPGQLPARAADLAGALAAGEAVATLAGWEQGASADLTSTSVMAATSGTDVRLTGSKLAVPYASYCDAIMTFARDESGVLVLALADAGAPGVVITGQRSFDRTTPRGRVRFDHARGTVLAAGQDAVSAARLALNCGAIHTANDAVGGAQACLDLAVDYARHRYQFGRPIGSQQAIKHQCADVLVELELARCAADAATASLAAGSPAADSPASLAKALASQAYLSAADLCLHVHGGLGFTWEHDAHLFLRRARAASLDFGDIRFHRDRFLATSPATRPDWEGTR